MTGPSTHEQVANLRREKHEIPTFFKKKILSLFRDWSIYSPMSREKSLLWTRDWGMWLVLPATKSPEQGNTFFEFLTIFVKTKYFPKTTKTLKKKFVIDQ